MVNPQRHSETLSTLATGRVPPPRAADQRKSAAFGPLPATACSDRTCNTRARSTSDTSRAVSDSTDEPHQPHKADDRRNTALTLRAPR